MATAPTHHDVQEEEPEPGDLPVEPEMDIGMPTDAEEGDDVEVPE